VINEHMSMHMRAKVVTFPLECVCDCVCMYDVYETVCWCIAHYRWSKINTYLHYRENLEIISTYSLLQLYDKNKPNRLR